MAYTRVNWQPGTKESDAYIEKDGEQYIFHPAVYSGPTPANPTSLNIMDAGIDENSKLLNGKLTVEDITLDKVEFKNKFNKETVVEDSIIDLDGSVVSGKSGWCASDFIPIKANTKYVYQGITNQGSEKYSAYYDSNKQFISYFRQETGSNKRITTPNGAQYVRFSMQNSDKENFQLELGEYSTQYIPYKEFTIPKVVNDLSGDSTTDAPSIHAVKERTHEDITTDGSPAKCGYKIDNKDVYVVRKSGGYLPDTSSKTVDTGVIGGNLVDIKGQIFPPTGNQSPIPYNSPSTGVYGYYNPTTGLISITTLSNRSDNTFYIDFYFTYGD